MGHNSLTIFAIHYFDRDFSDWTPVMDTTTTMSILQSECDSLVKGHFDRDFSTGEAHGRPTVS